MTARLARKLKGSERPVLLSAELAGQGILNALAQTMALALRHWWPAAAVLGVFSRRARQVVLAAAVFDAVVEYARLRPQLPFACLCWPGGSAILPTGQRLVRGSARQVHPRTDSGHRPAELMLQGCLSERLLRQERRSSG